MIHLFHKWEFSKPDGHFRRCKVCNKEEMVDFFETGDWIPTAHGGYIPFSKERLIALVKLLLAQ